MPRSATAALVTAAVAIVALVVAAATTTTTRAFTIGVFSILPSPPVRQGEAACQRPIRVPRGGEFDRVDFQVGTFHRPRGPALEVVVRPLEDAFPERRGVLPAGYPDVGQQQRHVVEVGRVPTGARVEVCIVNRGPRPVALFGNGGATATESRGSIAGRRVPFDFDLVFRREPRSFRALVPEMLERASLFRPSWVTPELLAVLVLLTLVGLPLLVARASRDL